MKARISILITVTMLALAAGPVVAQSGNDLFQQALGKERTEGNTAAAIALYQTIVEKHASDRALVAKALVQMGHCYEKLQQQGEARNVYERVVREYSNQKEAAAEASAWLKAHGASTRPQTELRVERIWTGPDVDLQGRVSPDGRYVTFADSTHRPPNLALRDLKTGENRLLTHDATSKGFAADSLVSPDGKQIAYLWAEDNSIRLIGVDGKGMRVLTRREYGDTLAAYSPDGRRIAAYHANFLDKTREIVLISTADGSVTQLKSTGLLSPYVGGFSPDGRFLVYSLTGPAAAGGGVFALAIDGSQQTALVHDSANNTWPVWSPDGRRVIFISDRSGANGLWSIRVQNGRPEGSPELLRGNIGDINPMGFTRDGAFYYGTQRVRTEAYVAEVDLDTLAVKTPTVVTDRFVGSNFEPEFSPDGKYVAFLRRPVEAVSDGSTTLIVRSLTTGVERTLANVDAVSPYARNLHWFPDNRSILVQSSTRTRNTFRQINVETGEARVLFEGPYGIGRTAALSPDGKSLFYSLSERASLSEPGTLRLVKRRLETGEEVELHRKSGGYAYYGLTVSADGSWLAFSTGGSALMIMPADGGTPRDINRSGNSTIRADGAMIWTKDGRHLVTMAKRGPGSDWELCLISSEGGELQPLGLRMDGLTTGMLSSDGRRIAFTSTTQPAELWVIRNLLSEPAKGR